MADNAPLIVTFICTKLYCCFQYYEDTGINVSKFSWIWLTVFNATFQLSYECQLSFIDGGNGGFGERNNSTCLNSLTMAVLPLQTTVDLTNLSGVLGSITVHGHKYSSPSIFYYVFHISSWYMFSYVICFRIIHFILIYTAHVLFFYLSSGFYL